MKKLKFLKVIICLLFFSFIFAGCGKESDDYFFDRSSILIGIAMPGTYVRWTKDGEAIEKAAIELGYKTKLVYSDDDQEKQNTQIRSLIDEGARLIIVANNNSDIKPVITEAKKAGVAIIAYDRLIQDSGDYDYYITFNNYQVGQMQGQALIDALDLKAQKNIVLFAGAPTDKNADFYFSGAMEVLKEYIDSEKLKVLGGSELSKVGIPDWNASKVDLRIDEIFDGITSIHAILAPNDNCARYIIEKYEDKYPSDPYPFVTGQDAEFESAKYIKDGKQLMTVYKNTPELAKNAVKMADQLLEGTEINFKGVTLATGDLAEMGNTGVKKVKTYLMAPVSITKDNLDDLIGIGWFTSSEEEDLK